MIWAARLICRMHSWTILCSIGALEIVGLRVRAHAHAEGKMGAYSFNSAKTEQLWNACSGNDVAIVCLNFEI